jgi:NitT/TauT family transport system permease protein
MTISATRAGVRAVDSDVLRLSIAMGATKRQVFGKVLLPVAAPAIFAVLRLGLIYSLLGVISSELIASRDGLGQLIATYSGQFRMEAVYGILIVLMILSAFMNQLVTIVEGKVFRWVPPQDR